MADSRGSLIHAEMDSRSVCRQVVVESAIALLATLLNFIPHAIVRTQAAAVRYSSSDRWFLSSRSFPSTTPSQPLGRRPKTSLISEHGGAVRTRTTGTGQSTYTTICFLASSEFRKNLRVRSVTSDMIAVVCGVDETRQSQASKTDRFRSADTWINCARECFCV